MARQGVTATGDQKGRFDGPLDGRSGPLATGGGWPDAINSAREGLLAADARLPMGESPRRTWKFGVFQENQRQVLVFALFFCYGGSHEGVQRTTADAKNCHEPPAMSHADPSSHEDPGSFFVGLIR